MEFSKLTAIKEGVPLVGKWKTGSRGGTTKHLMITDPDRVASDIFLPGDNEVKNPYKKCKTRPHCANGQCEFCGAGTRADGPVAIPGWIRNVIRGMSSGQLQRLCAFATGMPCAPRRLRFFGWTIAAAGSYPVAHTCFSNVDMPVDCSSEDDVRTRLLGAVYGSVGFAFA